MVLPADLLASPPWQLFAACAGADPGLFFTDPSASSAPGKAVCARCPVEIECLDHAVTYPEIHGIWGGTSERQRRRLRRARRSTAEGIATHIGAEFKRDRGRRARVGDIHRTRTMDGSYHRLAYWYVRTPRGWCVSPHGTRRPTPSEIKLICATARPGRPYRRRTPDPRRTPK